MASDMIKAALKAEAAAAQMKKAAEAKAKQMIAEAEKQCETIISDAETPAASQAHIILSDARYTADGVIKQAEKLAEMREKKSIYDTEKLYDEAIRLIFEEILK